MKNISDIHNELERKEIIFHQKVEHDIFEDSLTAFLNKKYVASAVLCATLYEMIFTTRLIRETANPEGFAPSKDNIGEQLHNLKKQEDNITNIKKPSFRSITKQLQDKNILSQGEKKEFDSIYNEVRNPVLHGLTFRLFKKFFGREPTNPFEVDMKYDSIYKKAAQELIVKIYELMTVKVLRKK